MSPLKRTIERIGAFVPLPSVYHWLPSHLATLLAGLPPAVVKSPPTNNSLPLSTRLYTPLPSPSIPLALPSPNGCHWLPSHLAIRFASIPPAVVKEPPAYRVVPSSASARAS